MKHESGKFQSFHVKLRDNTTHSKGLNTTFIPVLHEKGQPGAAIFIQRLVAVCMFLAWFIRRAEWKAWLLEKFPAGIPASHVITPLVLLRDFTPLSPWRHLFFKAPRTHTAKISAPPQTSSYPFSKLNGVSLIHVLSIQILSKKPKDNPKRKA